MDDALAARLASIIEKIGQKIDCAFDAHLIVPDASHARLIEAMRYAAMNGGKRLRPVLVMETAKLLGADMDQALRVATALECVHVYSLIHDDLPCMDDDDLRRGKPTVHRAYDEAIAVLAGDALQALAFEILSDPQTHSNAVIRSQLVLRLAQAAGAAGMVGGQMMDIAAEQCQVALEQIQLLQRMKTGALIEYAVEAGALLGRADAQQAVALQIYAQHIGIAFQIADDLLDVSSDVATIGKAVKKDSVVGKATFVSVLGFDAAHTKAQYFVTTAIDALACFGQQADILRAIAHYTLERRH